MQVKADRQYYIDWLRAGAMFLLVFYHSGRFDEPGWHLKTLREITLLKLSTVLTLADADFS
jgi:hypothetical protein